MNDQPPTMNHEPSTTNHRSGKGGPATPEGRKRSSLNALKHGLRAQAPHALAAIEQDPDAEYQSILDDLQACYQPADAVERELVKRIARCFWRLRWTEAVERRALSLWPNPNRPGKAHSAVLKHERMVDLQLYRAIRALARKRDAANKKSAPNELMPRST